MPGMSGVELADVIRALPSSAALLTRLSEESSSVDPNAHSARRIKKNWRLIRFERDLAFGGQGFSNTVRPVRNVSRSVGALIPWPRRRQSAIPPAAPECGLSPKRPE
jgi:hypothetical protein